jgi:hypothetical protein
VSADDRYSGEASVGPYFCDVFDAATLEVELSDAGRHLRLVVGANSFLGPATFDGTYVGP